MHAHTREGASDVLVSSRPGSTEAVSDSSRRAWFRQDLWRAVLDHHSGATHVYNRETRTTTVVAAPELTVEPNVVVPSVTVNEVLEWMTTFADEQAGPIQTALRGALQVDDPLRAFDDELGRSPSTERRWRRALRAKVTQRVAAWAQQNDIPVRDLESEEQPPPKAAKTAKTAARISADTASWVDDDTQLRERILRAVSAMPLSELLKLAIPVEYVLRR